MRVVEEIEGIQLGENVRSRLAWLGERILWGGFCIMVLFLPTSESAKNICFGLDLLGGMIQVASVEGRLRPGMAVGVGYMGFLASWMVRHHPLRVSLAAFLLAAIAVGGDSLQIDSGLPAAAINILMAVVLLALLGRGQQAAGTGAAPPSPALESARAVG